MQIMDSLQKLLISAVIIAVVGGLAAFGLGMLLPVVQGINIVGAMLGGIIGIVLFLYISKYSEIETTDIGMLVPILALASIIGTFVVGLVPMATGYILTLQEPLTWMSILWTMVYAGIALAVADKIM